MFRDQVLVVDAIVAVTLVESSMQSSALMGVSSALHSSFPIDAQEEFSRQGLLLFFLKKSGILNHSLFFN